MEGRSVWLVVWTRGFLYVHCRDENAGGSLTRDYLVVRFVQADIRVDLEVEQKLETWYKIRWDIFASLWSAPGVDTMRKGRCCNGRQQVTDILCPLNSVNDNGSITRYPH